MTHDPVSGSPLTRRDALRALAVLGASTFLAAHHRAPRNVPPILTRKIPSSGELLPLVGLGSWITFNVGDDAVARDECADVIRHFAARGGRLIDSSPMYGSSEETIGYGLRALKDRGAIFSADKVWTSSASEGPTQIVETERRWGLARLDLLQVHNLEAWEAHLPMLFAMKAQGKVRYVGVTTSHGRRMSETEKIVRTQPVDFVQVTYNVLDREAEQGVLPAARDRGIAVITNRPFREGELLRQLQGRPLPPWGAEFGGTTWPRFLLKFIVSHPAVNCAIPATSRVAHVEENMDATYGVLPDDATRKRMIAYVESLS